jgi:hypothetical protein
MAKKNSITDGMPKTAKSKKVKIVKEKKINEYTFNDMNKELNTISLYGSKMSENTFSEVDHYISFGSYVINAACTGSIYGGIPNNRSIALAGPSGCLHKDEIISIYKMKTMSSNRKILNYNDNNKN